MKYLIVPKDEVAMEINARNKEDAIVAFAGLMDFDMHTYFDVLTEEEYEEAKRKKEMEITKNSLIDFYLGELGSSYYDIVALDDMQDVADRAYEAYSHIGKYPFPENATEYECLEWAVREYEEKGNQHVTKRSKI